MSDEDSNDDKSENENYDLKIDAHGINNPHLNSATYCGKDIFVLATPRWDSMEDLDHPIYSNGPRELVKRYKETCAKSEDTSWNKYSDIIRDFHKYAKEKNVFAKAYNFFAHLENALKPDDRAFFSYAFRFEYGLKHDRIPEDLFKDFWKNKHLKKATINLLKANGCENAEDVYNAHLDNLELIDSFYEPNDFNYETEAAVLHVRNKNAWIQNAGTNQIFRVRNDKCENLNEKIRKASIETTSKAIGGSDRYLDFLNRGILGFFDMPEVIANEEKIKRGDVYILASEALMPVMVRSVWGWPEGTVGVNERKIEYAVKEEKTAKDIAERISQMELGSYLRHMGHGQDEAKADWHKYRKPLVVVKFD